MKAIIKSIVLKNEDSEAGSLAWLLSPPTCRDPLYAIGFKFELTTREQKLVETNAMTWHAIITIYQQYRQESSGWFADPPVPLLTLPERNPVPFIDAIGAEFVPVVTGHMAFLAGIEKLVAETAETWTRFFETMPDPAAE